MAVGETNKGLEFVGVLLFLAGLAVGYGAVLGGMVVSSLVLAIVLAIWGVLCMLNHPWGEVIFRFVGLFLLAAILFVLGRALLSG